MNVQPVGDGTEERRKDSVFAKRGTCASPITGHGAVAVGSSGAPGWWMTTNSRFAAVPTDDPRPLDLEKILPSSFSRSQASKARGELFLSARARIV